MRPRDLQKLLAVAFAKRLSVLITGAPGVGKTDIVLLAALAAGCNVIISHPVVADPTDAKGLPWPEAGVEFQHVIIRVRELIAAGYDDDQIKRDVEIAKAQIRKATFLPFGELAEAIEADTPTIWFIDDLGQALPAVQASFMQLILARRVNGHKLPDCVTFCAATNLRQHRAGVSGVLEPVKSRFHTIVSLEPNHEDSINWYTDNGYPPELIAFLHWKKDLLWDFQPTADIINSPSPRTWANASKWIGLGLPADIEMAAIQGAVGEGPGAEFAGFLRVWRELPSLDGILTDPDSQVWPGVRNPSARYATVGGLGLRANPQNFARIVKYIENKILPSDEGEVFAVLLARDAVRRNGNIAHTPAFHKLMVGPIGHLIIGSDVNPTTGGQV